MYLSNVPNSSCTSKKVSRVIDRGDNLETVANDAFVGKQPLDTLIGEAGDFLRIEICEARRYASRFRSTMSQLNPACAASSVRNSNCLRSSCTGTPHSSSW